MILAGYTYDAASYYRARYYDPSIGRFISEDPIQFRGGINFYAYVRNNPVNLTDPFGLCDHKKNLFICASEFASKYSIAGGLQALGIGGWPTQASAA
jgi:RHS repeat-associated protein